MTHSESVTLREITVETYGPILKLEVSDEQKRFVASNAVSIAQAYFEERAWFRGIYAGDTPIGFAMLDVDPAKPEYYLWRFMIDHRYQGRGYGYAAMKLLIEHVRTLPNAKEFITSVVQAEGGPQGFYEKLGFYLTGEYYDDGEAVMRLELG